MSLRAPRRRISPRARRRYRAIRNFFRRTLSSLTSLSGNKMNSSTTENVTNLNRSDAMGHHLHSVPQSHRGLSKVNNIYRRHTEDLTPREKNDPNSLMQRRRQFSAQEFIPNESGTKILYKTSNNLSANSQECSSRCYNDHSGREQFSQDRLDYEQCSSSHEIPNRKPKRNKPKTYENFNKRASHLRRRGGPTANPVSGFDSYDSLTTPVLSHPGYADVTPQYNVFYGRRHEHPQDMMKVKRRRDKPNRYKAKNPHLSNERRKKKKFDEKPPVKEEDQFIADIIHRQYKPVSFFGRRASDISQISTPVCRDERYSARDMVIPDNEVSSFDHGPVLGGRHPRGPRVREMRSIGDMRLCSAPGPARQRRRRADNYNDSNYYDVVPVKEKTSPKSRRKFIEDNLIMNEVPPSPRTHRPRLNLETQNYSEFEEYEQHENPTRRRRSPNRRPDEYVQTFKHDESTEESPRNLNEINPKYIMRPNNTNVLHGDIGTTMSSQQYLTSQNETANNTLNYIKAKDKEDADDGKTDKALCEIKNILQNFLQELKKDSSTSQCDEVSGSDKSGKPLDETHRRSDNGTSNAMKNNSGPSFKGGFGLGHATPCPPTVQPQFIPGYANPCCYPQVMPVYGAHGVPYLVASPSCVCAGVACGHNHARPPTSTQNAQCRTCSKVNCTEAEPTKTNCETDVLIREIYNYVAGNRSFCKKESVPQGQPKQSPSTAYARGKSMHAMHQDANVGTTPLRCYSRSCEAIVSAQQIDTYYAAYPSYSDSLLEERLSREGLTDYRMPCEANEYNQMPCETNEYNLKDKRAPNKFPKQQTHDSKFTSALRLLRNSNKKNRKENIHDVCHSQQSVKVDMMANGPNFRQDFTTYTVHGQEFVRPPPLRHDPRFPPTYDYDYSPHGSQMTDYSNTRVFSDRYGQQYECMSPDDPAVFDNLYEQAGNTMPRVPLCLKEVEVRSIGIQSEKKTAFRMFSQKKEASESKRPLISILRDERTTEDTRIPDAKQEKTHKLFNLKPQAAASKSEPMTSFSDRIQKDLNKNDKNMAHAMLRKLFYKRNPFSPQNRFVRTIMEKDNPTVFKWRPRLFL